MFESRKYLVYSEQEIRILLSEVNSGTPPSELERILKRPATGISIKITKLSQADPITWPPERIKDYTEQSRDYYRRQVAEYLKEHPNATRREIRKAGLGWELAFGYHNNINNARRDAGIDMASIIENRRRKLVHYWEKNLEKRKLIIEKQRIELIQYLEKNPFATKKDILNAGFGRVLLKSTGGLQGAKKDANIIKEGYISAAEAARILEITRERSSQLFEKGQLEGYRLGRFIYISLESVNSRKQQVNI